MGQVWLLETFYWIKLSCSLQIPEELDISVCIYIYIYTYMYVNIFLLVNRAPFNRRGCVFSALGNPIQHLVQVTLHKSSPRSSVV